MPKRSLLRVLAITGCACAALVCTDSPVKAQRAAVTAQIQITRQAAGRQQKAADNSTGLSEVVLWLEPLDRTAAASGQNITRQKPQVIQRNKTFEPHLLVVRAGSMVEFPNRDPFFHNVFSLFDGKRFDLGLYEAGTTNSVRFERVGVSFLFCNIHPEMTAIVVALDTPYYGISDSSGRVTIADVPDGRYEMHVWYERSLPDNLKSATRVVTISSGERTLGSVVIDGNPNFSSTHKNKFGQEYVPPPDTGYSHP